MANQTHGAEAAFSAGACLSADAMSMVPASGAAPGREEKRTRLVVALTAGTMVAELVVGFMANSMSLVADGFHMMTHAGALGLAAFAYWYARSRQHARHFSFGTGKVYALAGYTNAVALGLVAVLMLVESGQRLLHPQTVRFSESLPVAVFGLLVNLVSAWLLHPAEGDGHAHGHSHDHHHDHAHDHDDHDHDDHKPHAGGKGQDHNLRAAYVHVMADAFTSILAILALCGGWLFGWTFLDPLMGIVGAVVIVRWGIGLCRDSARQLLDIVPSMGLMDAVRGAVERDPEARVIDLHVWEIGPGRHGCVVALAASNPRETAHYRDLIMRAAALAHLTVEVHRTEAMPAPG